MRRYVVLPRPLLCRKSAKTGHRWNGVKVSAGDGSEGIDKCLPLAHTAMRGITRSTSSVSVALPRSGALRPSRAWRPDRQR